MPPLVNIIDTTWRPEFAYAVGLIAADGCLARKTKQISFVSKDIELVNLFQKSLKLNKRLYMAARGGETEKKYAMVQFKSKQLHSFLSDIGVTPVKSHTIRSVNLPDKYFADFFRGLYDGDGTFWTTWDKRWPNSFVYILGISSASMEFMLWLRNKLTILYGVKGFIHNGKGAYTIRYVKRDSQKLFKVMYYRKDLLYLSRKYNKIKAALDYDSKLKHGRRNAAVAQW